jgi:hypothetical protein
MLKFEDGTPASTPQMAHDVATFLDFLESKVYPDIRVHYYMLATTIVAWIGISWFYVKYHEFNLHSCNHYLFII